MWTNSLLEEKAAGCETGFSKKNRRDHQHPISLKPLERLHLRKLELTTVSQITLEAVKNFRSELGRFTFVKTFAGTARLPQMTLDLGWAFCPLMRRHPKLRRPSCKPDLSNGRRSRIPNASSQKCSLDSRDCLTSPYRRSGEVGQAKWWLVHPPQGGTFHCMSVPDKGAVDMVPRPLDRELHNKSS